MKTILFVYAENGPRFEGLEALTCAVDVAVTIGCGDACPLVVTAHYQEWQIPDFVRCRPRSFMASGM